jgi:hypothetical protein
MGDITWEGVARAELVGVRSDAGTELGVGLVKELAQPVTYAGLVPVRPEDRGDLQPSDLLLGEHDGHER